MTRAAAPRRSWGWWTVSERSVRSLRSWPGRIPAEAGRNSRSWLSGSFGIRLARRGSLVPEVARHERRRPTLVPEAPCQDDGLRRAVDSELRRAGGSRGTEPLKQGAWEGGRVVRTGSGSEPVERPRPGDATVGIQRQAAPPA